MFILQDKDIHTLSNYIVVVEKVIPEDVCDEIIDEFSDKNLWTPGQVGEGRVDENSRNVGIFNISDSVETRHKELDEKIYLASQIAIYSYNQHHKDVNIKEDTGYGLLRYKEGQFYTQHTDSYHRAPRAVSCSFALNDDYGGGEFAFFDRKIVTKIKKGSAIMFPSNFMFPHEIMQVKSGTRYSIITWFR